MVAESQSSLGDNSKALTGPGRGLTELEALDVSNVLVFLWKMLAVQPQSVLQAKQWIQRIVIGTIGVEMAGTLVHVLTGSVPSH